MHIRSVPISALLVCAVLIFCGCEEKPAPQAQGSGRSAASGPTQGEVAGQPAGTAPDAVPISVSVVPSPGSNPTKIDYTVVVERAPTQAAKLLIFVEVRDATVASSISHIDPDDVLVIVQDTIEVEFPAGAPDKTYSIDLKASRTLPAHITITAVSKNNRKGAAGTTRDPVPIPVQPER